MKCSHAYDLCTIDSCYSLIQGIGNQQSSFHPSVPKGDYHLSILTLGDYHSEGGLPPLAIPGDYHPLERIITSHDTEGLSLRGRIVTSRYPGGSSLRERISTPTTLTDYHSEGGLSPLFTLGDYHSDRGLSPLTTLRDYHSERGLSPLTTLGAITSWRRLSTLMNLRDYNPLEGMFCVTKVILTHYSLKKYCRM